MRTQVVIGAFVLATVTAFAAPLLPDGAVEERVIKPADRAATQVAQAGADAAGNILRAATLSAPEPRQPIDFDNLIRINGKDYAANYSENFSDKVESLDTIKKIGFGKATEVSIIKTPSGVYSTDGLASPNVLYPDIETRRVAERGPKGYRAAVWQRGFGWMSQTFSPAHSVITFGRIEGGGRFISGNGSTCFKSASFKTCK